MDSTLVVISLLSLSRFMVTVGAGAVQHGAVHTSQQCDAIDVFSGAGAPASEQVEADEVLSLLQESTLVHAKAHLNASQGSMLDNKPGWYRGKVQKMHPKCRFPFQNLVPHFGTSGDLCEDNGGTQHNWFCPDGCEGAFTNGKIASPYCLEKGTRKLCVTTTCPDIWGAKTELHADGSRLCRMTQSVKWFPPHGCKEVRTGAPWTADAFASVDAAGCYCDAGKKCTSTSDVKTQWCYVPWNSKCSDKKKGHQLWWSAKACAIQQATICRLGNDPVSPVNPTGMWVLVATKNGGGDVSVEIEVGFSSMDSKETTREETSRFFTSVETSASGTVGGPGYVASASVTAYAEYETTSKLAETVKSAAEFSSAHAVQIKCPGYKGKMTWVYQWQISSGKEALKSEHFRCHYTQDGYERPPECPPNACGNAMLNSRCRASPADARGKNGRDPSCIKHVPGAAGCYYRTPTGCKGKATGTTWTRDSFGEQHFKTKKDPLVCTTTRKKDYDTWCGVTDTTMLWVPEPWD